MSETPPRFDIYDSLPQGLVPRGLIPAAAAAYVGLDPVAFARAVANGDFHAATMPGGVFDIECLKADIDRLSGLERSMTAPVDHGGALSAVTGNAGTYSVQPAPAMDAKTAWGVYFRAQLEFLDASLRPEDADPEMPDVLVEPDPSGLAAHGRNLQWLVEFWLESKDFKTGRAVKTLEEYRRSLRKTASHLGAMPLVCLADPDIAADLDDWADVVEETSGPREADARLAILSSMLTWAARSRHVPEIKQNCVMGFRRRHSADRSAIIYTDEEISRLLEKGNLQIGTGVLIASETALRISDVLHLRWTDYDGDTIKLVYGKQREGKPKKALTIPCTSRLKEHLDAMDRRGSTVLTTPTGKRWDRHNFSNGFRSLCRDLSIDGKHFHDLRGTAITRFAELGLTAEQISSVTGHSLKTINDILQRYLARTATMARAVIQRVDESRSGSGDASKAG